MLWPLLDLTTTLDPNLLVAYRFGSTFLSEHSPRGAGQPELGIELLERGIQANPEYWRFYEDLGFIYYFELKDYAKASAAFAEGSKNPNAQIWMKIMAAKIAAEGESLSTSIFLWNEVYQIDERSRSQEKRADAFAASEASNRIANSSTRLRMNFKSGPAGVRRAQANWCKRECFRVCRWIRWAMPMYSGRTAKRS